MIIWAYDFKVFVNSFEVVNFKACPLLNPIHDFHSIDVVSIDHDILIFLFRLLDNLIIFSICSITGSRPSPVTAQHPINDTEFFFLIQSLNSATKWSIDTDPKQQRLKWEYNMTPHSLIIISLSLIQRGVNQSWSYKKPFFTFLILDTWQISFVCQQ